VSTAILYLAIIAIWAGVLVPRLIKRGQHGSGSGSSGADVTAADRRARGARDEYEADAYETAPYDGGVGVPDSSAVPPGRDDEGIEFDFPDNVDTEEISMPRSFLRGRPLWTEHGGWRTPGSVRSSEDVPVGETGRPIVTRELALRARRRLLMMLVGLFVLTLALVIKGPLPGWMLVPPMGVLGVFLLLLREAARADAEIAERRAAEHAERMAERDRVEAEWAVENERQAAAAAQHEAEVIDISGRVGDQLYDQYADAVYRAVGD
jgi:hypothetical protein